MPVPKLVLVGGALVVTRALFFFRSIGRVRTPVSLWDLVGVEHGFDALTVDFVSVGCFLPFQ